MDTLRWSAWQRFWHEPVRAERLAATRILLGLCLLLDQLLQYWPHFEMFYGPAGVAPQGVHDEWLLSVWRWTILIFNTDYLPTLYFFFWARVAVTVAFVFGWQTRLMSVALWFLTMCWVNRNPALRNGAEDTLGVGLFLLMLSPCGRALSIDAWLRRRLHPELARGPIVVEPWSLRLIQIQVCMIYMTTGLAKLLRPMWEGDPSWGPEAWFVGTWWEGSSLHYVFCDTTMGRWSPAQFALPYWVTVVLTYAAVWWETLFPVLVALPWTRRWTLWSGVLFHLGIYLTIEVGWFGFYTIALYGVWIPGEFWDRLRKTSAEVGINRT